MKAGGVDVGMLTSVWGKQRAVTLLRAHFYFYFSEGFQVLCSLLPRTLWRVWKCIPGCVSVETPSFLLGLLRWCLGQLLILAQTVVEEREVYRVLVQVTWGRKGRKQGLGKHPSSPPHSTVFPKKVEEEGGHWDASRDLGKLFLRGWQKRCHSHTSNKCLEKGRERWWWKESRSRDGTETRKYLEKGKWFVIPWSHRYFP